MTEHTYKSKLTSTEFKLLSLLNQSKGNPVSNAIILEKVFKNKTDKSKATAVYINYIRKKLEGIVEIKNYRGVGYSLERGGW